MLSSNGMVIYTIARILELLVVLAKEVYFHLFYLTLMLELSLCEHWVRVGNHLYNLFVYADDVSLFSITVPGLQKVIDICTDY